jgi:quercetin dioxygenase-like cupin family protein
MRKVLVLTALGLAVPVVTLTTAQATTPKGATRTEISKAVLTGGGPVEFKPGTETVVLKVTLEPGGSTGWHSHPDGGVFIVDKGALTNYGLNGAACEGSVAKAGEAYFVPPHAHHPHLGKNHGTDKLEVTVYYFNIPAGQPSRIDQERPKECPADLN